MTTGLCKAISDTLGLDPFGYSTNLMRQIIEEKLDECKNNILGYIGTKSVEADIIITKEENNRLFNLQNLHDAFMNEMEEELELTK